MGYITLPRLDLDEIASKLRGAIYEPHLSSPVDIKIKGCHLRIHSTGKVACLGRTEGQIRDAVNEFCRQIRDLGFRIPQKPSIRVVSRSYSTSIRKRIRLRKAEFLLEGAKYQPKTGRLTMELDRPPVHLQLFEDGKMVCLGARTKKQAEQAFSVLKKLLLDFNITEYSCSMRSNKSDGSFRAHIHVVTSHVDPKARASPARNGNCDRHRNDRSP